MGWVQVICAVLMVVIVQGQQDDLYAVILSTSKFWFNYRQGTNAYMMYNVLKSQGVRDENIILMIPENNACNPRNNDPGIVSPFDGSSEPNLFRNIEVDYKHSDVMVMTFQNILRGRYSRYIPQSKRLKLNKNARILVYQSGHGGNGYIKMQDTDVMLAEDLERTLTESYNKKLYKGGMYFSDSCSAFTIFDALTSPNIIGVGSSSQDEYSYSFGRDSKLQLSKTDRFSMATYEFFTKDMKKNFDLTLSDLLKKQTFAYLGGHYGVKSTFPNLNETSIYLKDYWSNQRKKQTLNLRFNQDQPDDEKYLNKLKDFSESTSKHTLPRSLDLNKIRSRIVYQQPHVITL